MLSYRNNKERTQKLKRKKKVPIASLVYLKKGTHLMLHECSVHSCIFWRFVRNVSTVQTHCCPVLALHKFPPVLRLHVSRSCMWSPKTTCGGKIGFGEDHRATEGGTKSVHNIPSSVGLARSRYSICAVRRSAVALSCPALPLYRKLLTQQSVSTKFYCPSWKSVAEGKNWCCDRRSFYAQRAKVLPLKFMFCLFFPTGIMIRGEARFFFLLSLFCISAWKLFRLFNKITKKNIPLT